MSANPKLISTVRNAAIRIQNADGTAFKSLGIAPVADGSRVKAIHITSDDTSDVVLQFAVTISAVDYILGEITVPDGAGTNGVDVAVSGLNPTQIPALQTDGIVRFLELASGSDLKVRANSAVTAAKTVNVFAEIGDFT